MTNTQITILSILSVLALWIWFRIYTKDVYEKGKEDMRKYMTENNHEAKSLMAGAVNRSYAEWRVYDAQTGRTEFKWIEPKK